MTAFAIATEDALSEAVAENLLTPYPQEGPPHRSGSVTTASFVILFAPTGKAIGRRNIRRAWRAPCRGFRICAEPFIRLHGLDPVLIVHAVPLRIQRIRSLTTKS